MDLEMIMRLPRWLSGKESTCQCRRCVFDPWFRKLPPEKEMTTHFGILAWEIPWTEEPGGPQSTGLQRVARVRATEHTCSLLTGLWQSSVVTKESHFLTSTGTSGWSGTLEKGQIHPNLRYCRQLLMANNPTGSSASSGLQSPISHSSWKVPANSVLNFTWSTSILVALIGMIKPSWLQLD